MPDRWINDHIGHEVTPRPGFEAELETTLRGAWSTKPGTEPVRRVPVGGGHSRQPRRLLVAALGAAAALVAAVLTLAIARGGDSSNMPADPTVVTGPPVPTAPTTTAAEPSTSSAAPPTTVSPSSVGPTTSLAPPSTALLPGTVPTELVPTDAPEGFYPACSERNGQAAANDLMASPSFGPLSSVPTLTVHLPAAVDPADYPAAQRITSPKTQAEMIPGGILVVLNQSNGMAGSMLAAVNLDGSIRWVRCTSSGEVVAWEVLPPVSAGAPAYVRLRSADDVGDVPPRWVEVDLATGSFGASLTGRIVERNPTLGELPPLTLVGQTSTTLLLANFSPLSGQDDRLLLVDRATLEAEALPDAGATTSRLLVPSFDPVGRPIVTLSGAAGPEIVAVYTNGAWHGDDETLSAAVSYVFAADGPDGTGVLRAVDAVGSTLWRLDGVTDLNAEGFRTGSTGDVTIARGCFDLERQIGNCDEPGIVGVRSSDGTELWRKSGWWDVGPLGDGVALVREPTTSAPDGSEIGNGWTMIDAVTGQPIDGQQWPAVDTFETQCCAGYEFVRTERTGGVVIAVNERRITVWYPVDAGLPPATATLP
jgi:hypothetical protein